MDKHALLKLRSGHVNYYGLGNILFHYPPSSQNEQNLFDLAIRRIDEYDRNIHYSWALFEKKNMEKFSNYLNIEIPSSRRVIIPTGIGHGMIHFNEKLYLPEFTYSDQEKLVKIFLRSGINPDEKAMDWFFNIRLKSKESAGYSLPQNEITSEIEKTFLRNLSFY